MNWELLTLADVCEVYQPETITQKEMSNDAPYPVFGANGQIGRYSAFNHPEPELVIGCRGSVGEVHITPAQCWITGNAMVVKPKPDVVLRDFLAYALRGGISIGDAISGTAQPQITRKSLMPIPIAIPRDLLEQRRIVAILDEAFAAIATAKANTEQNLANARAVLESHLQAVFNRRGNGWVERQLGEVAEFKNGLNFNQSSQGQAVRIVGVADFQEYYLVPTDDLETVTIDGDLDKGYEIREGDLLTVRSNGSKSLVGRCMMVPPIHGVISYSGFVIRIRCDQRTVLPAFLLHFMKSSDTRERLTRDPGGTNISNINQGKLSSLKLSLPPVTEQRQVVRKLDELRAETQRLESLAQQKLASLDALKASLLHHAFTGQLHNSARPSPKELVDA